MSEYNPNMWKRETAWLFPKFPRENYSQKTDYNEAIAILIKCYENGYKFEGQDTVDDMLNQTGYNLWNNYWLAGQFLYIGIDFTEKTLSFTSSLPQF